MNLHNLRPAKGSIKKRKRIGRGQGSGKGGTSTKGHKGAQSRSGYKRKLSHEGGQMPIQMRIPKFGFKCPNRIEYKGINLYILQNLLDKGIDKFDLQTFIDNGLANKKTLIKILAKGELKSKIELKVHAISNSAKNVVESLGGKVEILKTKK